MSLRMRRGLSGVVAVLVLAHIVLGASLGLSVDEAHYALYAAHPALSYFDHPPLVGWVQWPLVAWQAPVWVLRLLPGALWLGTVALVYTFTLRLAQANATLPSTASTTITPHSAAAWALASLLAAPLLHVLAISLLPDTLLMFFSVALLWQTQRLMQPQTTQHLSAWLLLGLLLGLAGLAKYTAIFTALAVACCLLWAHGWRLLRTPGLWLCMAVAALLITPVLVWNWQHQWISFRYQAAHGAGSAWELRHVLQFFLVQLLAYGPLLWLGLAELRPRRPHSNQRPPGLGAFFAIPFALFALMSGGGSNLPHWTAPAWVALAPFAGMALARAWSLGTRWTTWLLGCGLVAQALLCVALLGLMLGAGMPWMQGRAASATASDPPNPFADLHGWQEAGTRAAALAQQHQLRSVSVQNWTLASRLGWYARPLPVHVLEDRFDQFTLWAGPLERGASTLLVDWSQMPYVVPLGTQGFAQCQLLERQPVTRWGYALAEFRFYACTDWAANPHPQLAP